MAHAAYVFDAYGTLFDVHAAVRKHAEKLGPDAQRLSSLWREKQLEYSWVRALMGKYLDFWELTQQGLDTAFALVPSADKSLREDLLSAYWELDCYPEVPQVLTNLKATGAKIAILSNGSHHQWLDLLLKNRDWYWCWSGFLYQFDNPNKKARIESS